MIQSIMINEVVFFSYGGMVQSSSKQVINLYLVLCRLVYPGSKLKTVEYFKRHLNINVSVYLVYRFMDELHSQLKEKIEEITFKHTKKILKGRISVVFYDMTTLYFEASQEDDFRIFHTQTLS